MLHVRLTFLLRSRVVSVTYQYSYEISLSYVWRIKANVLLTYAVYMAYTKCTRDVSATYVLRSIPICGVSVLYQLLFNT